MAIPVQVTFDCADPDRLAHFWADCSATSSTHRPRATTRGRRGSPSRASPRRTGTWRARCPTRRGEGPRIFLQRVPEPKQVKNRVHLDVNVGGPRGTPDDERRTAVDAAVDRALGLGATKVRLVEERGERHYVMQDPEGNEFCLQ